MSFYGVSSEQSSWAQEQGVHSAGMAPQPSGHRMQTPAGGSRRSLTSPRTTRLLQRCRHCSRQVPGTHTLAMTAQCERCWEQVKQPFLHGCVQMGTPSHPLPALQSLHTRQHHQQTLQSMAEWVGETPGCKVKICSRSHGQRTGKISP